LYFVTSRRFLIADKIAKDIANDAKASYGMGWFISELKGRQIEIINIVVKADQRINYSNNLDSSYLITS
jgi:hypothetical protein